MSIDTPEGVAYGGGVALEEQANYLVRYHLLALASGMADRCYWYVLESPLCGLLDGDGKQHPAYRAYAWMANALSGSTFERRWPAAEGVYVLEFSKQGGRFLTAWTVDGGSYELAANAAEVRDHEGNRDSLAGAAIALGPSPLYVYLSTPEP